MKQSQSNNFKWFRNRGYLHLSDKIDIFKDTDALLAKIRSPHYVKVHSFLPLIHSVIKERRYKKIENSNDRSHTYIEGGKLKKASKNRPLHYATHIDALIFGYYSKLLSNKYEKLLKKMPNVSDSVIAYRQIFDPISEKNKGTVHFASEAFQEIKDRTKFEDCAVLKFDIKSFFSRLNHIKLKNAWQEILKVKYLPDDHYNVFWATTHFSYVLLDELRLKKTNSGVRQGFDERKLSQIRKKGIQAFYESPKELGVSIAQKEITVYKYPFRDKQGLPRGIPQGLPISSTLANIYLLNFDIAVTKNLTEKLNAYYRRYSDDMIIVCKIEQAEKIKQFISESILESGVEISEEKTEEFIFRQTSAKTPAKEKVIKIEKNGQRNGVPFTFLGFEYDGNKILIKSANLSKFYRRMISTVKRKAKKTLNASKNKPDTPPVVYRRQMYKIYTSYPLSRTNLKTRKKWLEINERDEYYYCTDEIDKNHRSNYLSYVNRASAIMKQASILKQIRNHKKIFNDTLYKHFYKKREPYS